MMRREAETVVRLCIDTVVRFEQRGQEKRLGGSRICRAWLSVILGRVSSGGWGQESLKLIENMEGNLNEDILSG